MILLTLSEYTLGCVLEEQSRSGDDGSKFYQSHRQEVPLANRWFYPHPDTAFEFGLSLIRKGYSALSLTLRGDNMMCIPYAKLS